MDKQIRSLYFSVCLASLPALVVFFWMRESHSNSEAAFLAASAVVIAALAVDLISANPRIPLALPDAMVACALVALTACLGFGTFAVMTSKGYGFFVMVLVVIGGLIFGHEYFTSRQRLNRVTKFPFYCTLVVTIGPMLSAHFWH